MQKLVLAAILWCVTNMVFAGPYVGADIGYATGYTHVSEGRKQAGSLLGAHAGYRIAEFIAAEVGYGTLLGVKVGDHTIDASMVHASGLLFLQVPSLLTLMLDFYGRVGVANTSAKALQKKHDKTTIFYGLGAEFNYLPLIGLRAEVQHLPKFAHQNNAITTFRAGVNIKF